MACKNGQNPDQKSGKTDVLNPFTQTPKRWFRNNYFIGPNFKNAVA